jgi:membrane peptidoglycan carboxypeptidase
LKKRGKLLGGKPPKRGGRLTGPRRDVTTPLPDNWRQLLVLVAAGFLVIGGVAGFAYGMDRQLRGGILLQRTEAMTRPDWVPIEEIPPYVPEVFLAVAERGGVVTGRFRGRNEGRTVSRELVRQIHLLGDGLTAQAKELVMSPVLERRTLDQDLIELYLNRVELGEIRGNKVYGIYHASREYFAKDPRELTLSEAATLAGLLLEPRINTPSEVPGAVGVRRNEVLRGMVDIGAIASRDYSAAIQEPLGFQPGIRSVSMTRVLPAPEDTAVIRLPPEYRPEPEDSAAAEPQ